MPSSGWSFWPPRDNEIVSCWLRNSQKNSHEIKIAICVNFLECLEIQIQEKDHSSPFSRGVLCVAPQHSLSPLAEIRAIFYHIGLKVLICKDYRSEILSSTVVGAVEVTVYCFREHLRLCSKAAIDQVYWLKVPFLEVSLMPDLQQLIPA